MARRETARKLRGRSMPYAATIAFHSESHGIRSCQRVSSEARIARIRSRREVPWASGLHFRYGDSAPCEQLQKCRYRPGLP
jgi:hypothetical protein